MCVSTGVISFFVGGVVFTILLIVAAAFNLVKAPEPVRKKHEGE